MLIAIRRWIVALSGWIVALRGWIVAVVTIRDGRRRRVAIRGWRVSVRGRRRIVAIRGRVVGIGHRIAVAPVLSTPIANFLDRCGLDVWTVKPRHT